MQRGQRVRDMNWNDPKYIRAGIIPVVEQHGVRFYGFGLDNNVGQLGDFGGHYEHVDADLLDTAIREYEEESLNVFGVLTRDLLQDCVVLDGTDTIEILVPVPPPFYAYTQRFRAMITTNTEHEIQDIVWLSAKQVITAIDSQQATHQQTKLYHMYTRIHDVLRRNRDAFY